MKKGKLTAVIPVRAGSQRVKNKNTKPFADSNLLKIKLKTLKKISMIDNIVVNSDSDEMLDIALSYGVSTHKREEYYAEMHKILHITFYVITYMLQHLVL